MEEGALIFRVYTHRRRRDDAVQKQRPRDPKEDDDDTEERERPRLKIGGRREERRLLKAVLTFTTFRKREMRMVKKRTFDDALARKETTESTVFVFASIYERCRLMNTTTLYKILFCGVPYGVALGAPRRARSKGPRDRRLPKVRR